MPVSVSNQAYVFLCSVIGGMLIAFIYDVFRIKRKAIKTRSIFIHIEDFLYWIIVAIVMFALVYYSNEGEIRGYIFLGNILGVILYSLLLSKIIINSSMFILNVIYKILKTICIVLLYPFKIVLKILKIPERFIFKILRGIYRKLRGAGKNRLAKVKIWRKVLKNFSKKI